jgi:monoamine oxidase
VSWDKVPYNEGAFVAWGFRGGTDDAYQAICRPQGRLLFAGEHASRVSSWMAGAIESARYVVKEIAVSAQGS